jgi:chromosome segregation ATPase
VQAGRNGKPAEAYKKLSMLAAKFQSRSVAKIAVALKSGGHFDKVIAMIDEMMVLLRKEEQEDNEHRDRCEANENANKNELEDLKDSIEKTKKALKRMDNEKKELEDEVEQLDKDIKVSKKDMSELLGMRNDEVAAFRQALKDDADAIDLLKKAIVALSKYYKNNKISMSALNQEDPEYKTSKDDAPKADFASSNSRKSETGGILAILEMLVEDLEKEMTEGRADDADAQAKYTEQNDALQSTLDTQEATKASVEKELGDLEEKMSAYEKFKKGKEDDKDAEDDTGKSLMTDCEWVKTHFKSRREKRKVEMDGLVDAKGFLAGVAAGNDELPLN